MKLIMSKDEAQRYIAIAVEKDYDDVRCEVVITEE